MSKNFVDYLNSFTHLNTFLIYSGGYRSRTDDPLRARQVL